MATQLFLLNTVADTHLGTNNIDAVGGPNVGWTAKALGTARGSGVVATDNNPTETAGESAALVGGIAAEWISPPLAADVTIASSITLNVWGSESNMSANVFLTMYIDVIRANTLTTQNSNTLDQITATTVGVEVAVTTRAVRNGIASPTSTAVNRGDRLRVRIVGGGGTAASGFTWNASYNGTTAAADGDTYVTFTETFSFESAPAGSQLFLTDTQSGLTYGTPVAPSLVSDFTGSDENPLSEGGNWSILNSSTTALQRVSNAVAGSSTNSYSYWTPADFGPDLEAYVTITTGSAGIQCGIVARVQGAGGAATWDGYHVTAANGSASTFIQVFTNAAATTLATGTASSAWGDGDKIGISCRGSTIQAWRLPSGGATWQLVTSVVDTTYSAAGKIGLRAFSTLVRLDDFYAGTDTNLWLPDAPALISSFTGADENPLSEGGNWALLNSSSSAMQRISNAASGSAVALCNAYWTPANFGPDMEAYLTISTLSGTFFFAFRIQGEGGAGTWDGYMVQHAAGAVTLRVVTNGADSVLGGPSGITWASGDKMGLRAEGSTLQIWRQASGSSDWNLLWTMIDTTYSSAGKIGIGASNSTVRLDDFYAATDSNLFTQKAWTSRGAGVVSYRSDTATGWTAPLYTTDWYTPELEAFTLTGMAQANIRALESNASANASLRCELARVESDGTSPTVWASWCCAPTGTDNGELTTSEVARTINVSGDDLAFTDGQRLRIRLYNEDISSAAMVDAFNVQRFFNGTSAAASGDTYVTLAQSVTEFTGVAAYQPRYGFTDHANPGVFMQGIRDAWHRRRDRIFVPDLWTPGGVVV